jgi:hypothetical protein
VLGCPLTHICLIVIIRLSVSAILVRLYCESASSGTRCSYCKPVVLVTLGSCHLLDGLVVVSVEARKEDCAVLRRSDCEGYCARPVGATKSNSSRACH